VVGVKSAESRKERKKVIFLLGGSSVKKLQTSSKDGYMTQIGVSFSLTDEAK
jgi:hypothetical protein